MKLLMIVQGLDAVATRYRALSYIPYLESKGWDVEVLGYDSSLAGRLAMLAKVRHVDVVFIQKKRLLRWQLRCIRKLGAKIIYDVDDAVMFRSSRHSDRKSLTRQRRFNGAIANADLVVAGNPYLAQMIREKHPLVEIQPLPFDLAEYPTKQNYEAQEELIIGWIGGAKSLTFLQALSPVFERLGSKYPHLKLKIVCNTFFKLDSMPVIEKQWAEEDEGTDVASFDIGLAPLPDDEWAKGKCGTKLLQCFSAAVPVVASPVGVHSEMIRHGENGLFAKDLFEWESSLEALIQDENLRRKMGQAGLEYAQKHHALEVLSKRFDEILRKVL